MSLRPLGQQILEARSRAKLTQKALADLVGVERQSINVWETGKNAPTAANVEALQRVLGVSFASDEARSSAARLLQLQGRSEELEALSAYLLSRQRELTDALRAVNTPTG